MTIVQFQAEFQVTETFTKSPSGADAGMDLSVRSQGGAVAAHLSHRLSETTTFATTLILPLSIHPGQPFDLESILASDSESGPHIVAVQFTFSGLPSGTSMVSCQGFRQDGPVATIPQSWGRLKASYR